MLDYLLVDIDYANEPHPLCLDAWACLSRMGEGRAPRTGCLIPVTEAVKREGASDEDAAGASDAALSISASACLIISRLNWRVLALFASSVSASAPAVRIVANLSLEFDSSLVAARRVTFW